MPFYCGQRVVCVNTDEVTSEYKWTLDKYDDRSPRGGLLQLKKEYTVIEVVHMKESDAFHEHFVVKLNGVDGYFVSSRFRPVSEKKTDISIFTKILDKEYV